MIKPLTINQLVFLNLVLDVNQKKHQARLATRQSGKRGRNTRFNQSRLHSKRDIK